MLRVGLTGGIGSGKSTVARILSILRVPVFGADEAGRKLLAEDPAVIQAVEAQFGPSVRKDGRIDRKALAAIVFNDKQQLEKLNGIVHPAVRKAFRAWADQQKAPYVVMEAAILRESGGDKLMDHLVWVWANAKTRVARVMKRDGVTEEEVRARMANQSADHERPAVADTVIMNDGIALVIPQVLALHQLLTEHATLPERQIQRDRS
jgi:dephospho-CoA kinase